MLLGIIINSGGSHDTFKGQPFEKQKLSVGAKIER